MKARFIILPKFSSNSAIGLFHEPRHACSITGVASRAASTGCCRCYRPQSSVKKRYGTITNRSTGRLSFKSLECKMLRANLVGTNVVIGHGRSPAWKDLKDFVKERLGLPHDEKVPIAGVTNVARLGQMLDRAAVALIVMTAEDETNDGKTQARMNVVHEVGLFQGRLGFDKAIIILEDGCEEFSNIQGLGQIRFPKSNISACFEQIREVLEREEMLAV